MGPITVEESELMRDPKYKVYVNNIEKALKNFEYSSEWPDLISALAKLYKVISSNTKFPIIPKRIKISKRLAQCMHPNLPFGVHLKALEIYDVIFKSMGTNRLSHELFIYSAGIFPLFGRAAMTVRPDMLTIYETHFVPLGPRFRPALPGFLSGVLPGLDKNSDHFDRTNKLLEQVCEGVEPLFFYGCLWECLASNSALRLPSIIFILTHFDKKLSTEDQAYILGKNIDSMLSGLMACIGDSSIYVQRNALDLLMLGFPMHNSHLTTDDKIRLVNSALFTILRRDISLKRRLYSWLLGSEVNMTLLSYHPLMLKAKSEGKNTSYFDVYSKDMLIMAVKIVLDNSIGVSHFDLRPFNLLISMLDKDKKEENIGQAILEDVLFEYLRLLYFYSHTESKVDKSELMQCVNTLFTMMDSSYLWQYMGAMFEKACLNVSSHCIDLENPVKRVASGDPGVIEICTLTEYLLDTVSLESTADTPSEHLPSLFLQIVTLLTQHCGSLKPRQFEISLKLCIKILTRVQPVIIGHHNMSSADTDTDPTDSSILNSPDSSSSSVLNENTDDESLDEKLDLPKDDEEVRDSLLEQCLRQYERFYVNFIFETRTKVGENNNTNDLLERLKIKNNSSKLKQLESVLSSVLTDELRLTSNDWAEPMKVASQLLVDLSTLQTFYQSANSQKVVESDLYKKDGDSIELLPEWLKVLITCTCWLNYTPSLQIVAIQTLLDLVSLCTTAQSLVSKTITDDAATPLLIVPLLTPNHLKYMEKNTFVFQVITHWLWSQLGRAEYRVKCVELLHVLHSVFPHNDIVESSIGYYLKPGNLESFRRFASLWHIGREINMRSGHSLRVSDIFYRSMLKMLENLKLPSRDYMKVEAEEWLMNSLLHGDFHRIVDPLVHMLLDSTTARLSILHIKLSENPKKIDKKVKNDTINTDFDEYYEEIEKNGEEKSESSQVDSENNAAARTFPSFIINDALKISSLDLLHISDTLFTRVSDGESLNRFGSFSSEGLSTCVENHSLVRSWSFPGKEIESGDLEESSPADEYFNGEKQVVTQVLSDIVNQVICLSGDELKPKKKLEYQSTITSHTHKVDPLHAHLLLYIQKYDHERVLYILETFRNILISNPRAFICSASTTGLVPRSPILKLLIRHRKSLFGRGFAGDLEGSRIKNAKYIEVILQTCLYFLRSYYSNLESVNINKEEVLGNKEVQISCAEILTVLMTELVSVVKEAPVGFSKYFAEIFASLKLYKILLHCTYVSLTSARQNSTQITHQILRFNDSFDSSEIPPRHMETLQKHLVRLLLATIILEYELNQRNKVENKSSDKTTENSDYKYINGKSIPQQPFFLTIITRALDITSHRHTHVNWMGLLTCTLPYLGPALTKVVSTSLKQICHNVEVLSECYIAPSAHSFPPDYGIIQIESLTSLCHFCLLETTTSFNSFFTSGKQSTMQFSNDLSFFFGNSSSSLEPKKEKNESFVSARKSVLGLLPRVIASVSILWKVLFNLKEREGENCEVGSPRVVKQQIIDFLSPIAGHHPASFVAAMAIVWREQRKPSNTLMAMAFPVVNEEQQVLVQLLIGIKSMPIDVFIQTLQQVVRQPANQEIAVSVEVSALELLVDYARSVPASSLHDSWPSLLPLLKEAPSLSPPAQFLLLGALSLFVERSPPFTDKKDQKDLRDVTIKLVESFNTIAGACLLNTNWFIRKNLTVREEEPIITPDKEEKYVDEVEIADYESLQSDETSTKKKSKLKRVTKKIRQDAEKLQIRAMHQWFMRTFVYETPFDLEKNKSGSNVAQYSIGALTILSQLLAPLLDAAFGSQEKDSVVNLLATLMCNVIPYLRNHTQRNAGSYYACSQLLSSITSHSYTRKAWKKEVTDLLFDPTFFQMESRSLKCWCTIINNLFSQEDTAFKEFLSKVAVPQSNSLNIFSSKEQEYEQRAQLLKRLAFVIYCGEKDQFLNLMPDINDRLADCMKMPQIAPNLHAQVFLCFRVILLRMSPAKVYLLWIDIIYELLQVIILLEKYLTKENEDASSLSSDSWMSNGTGNALQLQLAVVNLLYLAEQLPADGLTQFQMYRWAFIGDQSTSENADFIPHISRIADLMDSKYGCLEALPTPLIPTCSQIKSLEDLHPFFTAMRNGKYTPLTVSQLEHNLELDFLDIMAPR